MNIRKEHLDKMRELSSVACRRARKEREEEYLKNPRVCMNCGKMIPYGERKKFCSRSCAASYNNRERSKGNKEVRYCKYCGKPILKINSESWADYSRKNYCCSGCRTKYLYESYIKKWKNGEVTGSNGFGGVHKYVRKYLQEKYSNKCSECGWDKVNIHTGKSPLEVHHIDGNSDNNNEENLILLCPNCHSLTRNYKGANISKTKRSKYRKSYKDRCKVS